MDYQPVTDTSDANDDDIDVSLCDSSDKCHSSSESDIDDQRGQRNCPYVLFS